MTTFNSAAKASPARGRFRFPDPPEHRPEDRLDKMTNFNKMSYTGNAHYLAGHLGHPETTLVAGEHYLSPEFTRDMTGVRYPDLLVAFGVDPAAYRDSNAYVIAEQGKAPDFVLEIASAGTWRQDAGPKRDDYAAIGVGEYWRFGETGRYGGRLHGERLVNGEYVAIDIEELPDGSLQGYSPALNLYLRWQEGELVFHDPATGRRIATLADERARADSEQAARTVAEAELSLEREARATEQARADAALAAREAAEAALAAERAQVRQLEEQLRRQQP